MIQEGLVSITQNTGECVDHVKQMEKDYWATYTGMDDMTEPVVITLTESDEDKTWQMSSGMTFEINCYI